MRRRMGFGVATACALSVAIVASALAGQSSAPPPVLSGEPVVGSTLTASPSADAGDSFHHFRWERCDPASGPCEDAGWTVILDGSGLPLDEATYVLQDVDEGQLVRVRGKYTQLGNGTYVTSEPVGPVEPAAEEPAPEEEPPPEEPPEKPPAEEPPPPPPSQPAPQPEPEPEFLPSPLGTQEPPPPVAHETANLEPVQGRVLYSPDRGAGFIELTDPTQVPLGAIIDTTAGRVNVISARDEQGAVQTVEFWGGRFSLDQTQSSKPVTEIDLIAGPRQASSDTAGRAAKQARVWGKSGGKCRCRTNGNHSSGTVRGTHWLTADRPNGTLTKVKEGEVEVKDFGTGERTLVEAGERHLAEASD